MKIIDAQIHSPSLGGALGGAAPSDVELTPELKTYITVELAREAIDCVGIDKALVFAHQEFNAEAVRRYPDRFAGVLVFDHNAEDLEEQIVAFRATPGMVASPRLPEQLHAAPDVAEPRRDRGGREAQRAVQAW